MQLWYVVAVGYGLSHGHADAYSYCAVHDSSLCTAFVDTPPDQAAYAETFPDRRRVRT
jgi:hypothetical protein